MLAGLQGLLQTFPGVLQVLVFELQLVVCLLKLSEGLVLAALTYQGLFSVVAQVLLNQQKTSTPPCKQDPQGQMIRVVRQTQKQLSQQKEQRGQVDGILFERSSRLTQDVQTGHHQEGGCC
ncbi:hypothetical protein DC3_29010 [Deinococcus cellulosilyticus NBRC 106333 = KACC 11606]|uniref:Uncharacterized protein n=1 Tax=Deinococcus cellulosilyticus (strain DSM 18568 / NBRC 106333 / KACC 11606 / 5516J-15) TaxID=1223518 RepID=A0A511N4B9_DEIC1|nr:hypothetical protein DC3_29010 [Deinococcus cellulosilyticus NBRC 106333 = KACC 11606]